jgi:hypothetical protein
MTTADGAVEDVGAMPVRRPSEAHDCGARAEQPGGLVDEFRGPGAAKEETGRCEYIALRFDLGMCGRGG